MDVKEQRSVLAQVLYVKEKMSPLFFVLLRAFPAWKCHWLGVKIMQLLAKHIICVSSVKAVSKLNQFLAL